MQPLPKYKRKLPWMDYRCQKTRSLVAINYNNNPAISPLLRLLSFLPIFPTLKPRSWIFLSTISNFLALPIPLPSSLQNPRFPKIAIEMEEGRRRPMLSHQMSAIKNPSNPRNEKDEDEDEDEDDHETLTAGSASNRTLFDIIQNEESSAAFAYRGVFSDIGDGNKHNWKCFKDRLPIRHTGAAWNSSARPIPVCDDFSGNSCPRSPPEPGISVSRARSLVRSESRTGGAGLDLRHEEAEVEAAPVRVSLMALLEQTDSQLASVAAEEEEDGEEEEEDEEEEGGGGEKEYVCCVCMVRHNGAAFIPCGHTFCRMCSRELWVSRGNCPLCNGYILEILRIFEW